MVEDVGGGVVEGKVRVGCRGVDVGLVALDFGLEVAVGERVSGSAREEIGEGDGLDLAVTELGVLDVVRRASLVAPNGVAVDEARSDTSMKRYRSSSTHPPLSIIEVCESSKNHQLLIPSRLVWPRTHRSSPRAEELGPLAPREEALEKVDSSGVDLDGIAHLAREEGGHGFGDAEHGAEEGGKVSREWTMRGGEGCAPRDVDL